LISFQSSEVDLWGGRSCVPALYFVVSVARSLQLRESQVYKCVCDRPQVGLSRTDRRLPGLAVLAPVDRPDFAC
jgi:hypothetical protein